MQEQKIGEYCSDQTENCLEFPAKMVNDQKDTRVNLKDTQGFTWTSGLQLNHLLGTIKWQLYIIDKYNINSKKNTFTFIWMGPSFQFCIAEVSMFVLHPWLSLLPLDWVISFISQEVTVTTCKEVDSV